MVRGDREMGVGTGNRGGMANYTPWKLIERQNVRGIMPSWARIPQHFGVYTSTSDMALVEAVLVFPCVAL